MVKEQQLSNFPKLEQFIKDIFNRFSTDWPKILGQGTNIDFKKFNILMTNDLEKIINNNALLLEYEMSGERAGKLHLKIPFRDASIIGGSILMEEEEDIKKNFSSSLMNEDYLDAFGEFGNQTAASFETIFRSYFPEEDDNHVRFLQSYSAPFESEKICEIFSAESDDELLMAHSHCSIWSFDKGEYDLFIHTTLAEDMFEEIVTASTKKTFANILYVDSKKGDINLVKRLLRNTGFNTHICKDADAAIAKLQREKIDLVLIDTDFGSNEDDGLSLCIRIKRNMLLESIPILMTSAKATKQLVLDCVRIGASDFIVKPFNKDQLFAKLGKRVNRKKFSK